MSEVLFSKTDTLPAANMHSKRDGFQYADGYAFYQAGEAFEDFVGRARENALAKLRTLAVDKGYLGYTHVTENLTSFPTTAVVVSITGDAVLNRRAQSHP